MTDRGRRLRQKPRDDDLVRRVRRRNVARSSVRYTRRPVVTVAGTVAGTGTDAANSV